MWSKKWGELFRSSIRKMVTPFWVRLLCLSKTTNVHALLTVTSTEKLPPHSFESNQCYPSLLTRWFVKIWFCVSQQTKYVWGCSNESRLQSVEAALSKCLQRQCRKFCTERIHRVCCQCGANGKSFVRKNKHLQKFHFKNSDLCRCVYVLNKCVRVHEHLQ